MGLWDYGIMLTPILNLWRFHFSFYVLAFIFLSVLLYVTFTESYWKSFLKVRKVYVLKISWNFVSTAKKRATYYSLLCPLTLLDLSLNFACSIVHSRDLAINGSYYHLKNCYLMRVRLINSRVIYWALIMCQTLSWRQWYFPS